MRNGLLALLLLLFPCRLCSQTLSSALPTPTGVVTGHVVYADTQQPARLAHVVLQPVIDRRSPLLAKGGEHRPEGVFHLQTVGLDGSFVIPAVPQGLYYVIAEQDGYVSPLSLFSRDELNQPNDALLTRIAHYMTAVSVTAGRTTQAEVRLIRGATVSGRVFFEDGSPAINAGVVLLQRKAAENKDAAPQWKAFRSGGLSGRSGGRTDDQGNYRFAGLPTGEYLVRASIELNNIITDHIFSSNGSTSYGDGYHLQVYPGDTFRTRDAKPIKLEEGEAATAVDVDVPLSRLFSVSGTVLRPDAAAPVNAAHVALNFADTGDELTSTDVESEDGTFRFDFVPSGSYTMQASRISEVRRTEEPNCKGCIPPTHTKTETLATFGDVSTPLQLVGDLSGVVVDAKPGRKLASAGN